MIGGGTPEDKLAAMSTSDIQGMGLSPAEAAATLNLLKHVPPTSVDKLQRAASRHGMWRGPFSHAALASPALRMGYAPKADNSEHAKMMVSDAETVDSMVVRLVSDWESAPMSLRKTALAETIVNIQKVCRIHQLVNAEFKRAVPDEIYTREWPSLDNMFGFGSFDEQYKTISIEQPEVINLHQIPEIKCILAKVDKDLETHQLARRKDRVNQTKETSHESACVNQIIHDVLKIFKLWNC